MPLNFKQLLPLFFLSLLFASQLSASHKLPPPEKRIVGGEVAKIGDWPWMSALVFTYEDIPTELTVNNIAFASLALNFTPPGQVQAPLIDCQLGDTTCLAQDKICLIERGDINFSVKAQNCELGGGIGAIIYNNEEGPLLGNLGEDFSGSIPVIGVAREAGIVMLSLIGQTASVYAGEQVELLQTSSCGASFIGDRWVLTAAHCVDDRTASILKVNVGEFDLSDGAQNAIDVKNIYKHADYDSEVISNDIALLELTRPVNAPSLTLADISTTTQYAIENSLATVMGWGGRIAYAQGEGATSNFPTQLHQVELSLFTNQECRETLAESLGVVEDQTKVLDNMICAGALTEEKGACQGDSGGPLVVQTGLGWQQVGIVSWGYGCAVENLPGVYTRVSSFSNWIEAITEGIAIEQNLDFGVTAIGSKVSSQLRINNNGTQSVNLSFDIDDTRISVDDDNCRSLAPNQSCLLNLSFDATSSGKVERYLSITTDNNLVPTSRALVQAQAVSTATELNSRLNTNDAMDWYTGGDARWQINAEEGVLSGDIQDGQSSILLAQVQGEGTLRFDWSVSSEENLDDPDSPFDALYLYINGELIDFISGEPGFTTKQVALSGEFNNVYWVYKKDYADPPNLAVDDTAYLKNITFTGGNVISPTQAQVDNPTNPNAREKSSGGSALSWMILAAPILIFIRRKRHLKT